MDEERKLLVDAFPACKSALQTALFSTIPNPKSAQASDYARKRANFLCSSDYHNDALHKENLYFYNKSVASAPSGSKELALAYENRSAFLFHVGKYDECLQDIDKALEMIISDQIKDRLLLRKAECLKILQISTSTNVLEKAQSSVDIADDTKCKKSLEKVVEKFESMSVAKSAEDHQKIHKTINLPETDNVLEKISIGYTEKYGRHLVAEQNYNSGEIIFVEKLLSYSLRLEYHYINCHHCLKICWNGVPCDYCDWALFCSEECKQKAWQEYHDVECSLGTLLNFTVHSECGLPWMTNTCYKVVKIFIMALRDAGNFENLKVQLEAVDQCSDVRSKGFFKNGKLTSNTIESLYSLTKRDYSMLEGAEIIPQYVLIILMGLTKHPSMINFQLENVKDVIQNEDLIFLGSLLLKLTAIYVNNSYTLEHFLLLQELKFRGTPQHPRGSCVASLICLINNSCYPNANLCYTGDGKAIVYAVQPIKKNEQIFVSYVRDYSYVNLNTRTEILKKYKFECDCQACVKSWPPVLMQESKTKVSKAETSLAMECSSILQTIFKDDDCHEASLKLVAPKVTQAFETIEQPSTLTCKLREALDKCITNTYNGLKSQDYGVCGCMY